MSTDYESGPAQVTRYAGANGASRYLIAVPGSERSDEVVFNLSADEFEHLRVAVAAAAGSTHRGIEVRATIVRGEPALTILQTNSDMLHLQARYSTPSGEPAWDELLPPILDVEGKPFLLIEHRAVMLQDEYPDD